MRLTTAQINYLNGGLMFLSCLLAYFFPFELFLFSYAVLGPLHYLTEISWLHDRNYFIEAKRVRRARRAWLILVMITLAVMLYGFVAEKILLQSVTPVWEIALFLFSILKLAPGEQLLEVIAEIGETIDYVGV